MSGIDYELKASSADEMVDLYGDLDDDNSLDATGGGYPPPATSAASSAAAVSSSHAPDAVSHASSSSGLDSARPRLSFVGNGNGISTLAAKGGDAPPAPAPAYNPPSRKIYNDDG